MLQGVIICPDGVPVTCAGVVIGPLACVLDAVSCIGRAAFEATFTDG